MSKRSNVENVEVRDHNLRNLVLFILMVAFTCSAVFIAGAGWACDRGGGALNFNEGFKCVAYEQNGNLFFLPEGKGNFSVGGLNG
jgi:hypothetical protein